MELKIGNIALILLALLVGLVLFQSRPGKPEGTPRNRPNRPAAPKYSFEEEAEKVIRNYDRAAADRIETVWGEN